MSISKQSKWNSGSLEVPKEYVTVSPQKELIFSQQGNKYTAQLSLINPLAYPVLYKIRTTAANYYTVNPKAGRMNSREQRTVQIVLPWKDNIAERANDKFLVQAFPEQYYEDIIEDENDILKAFSMLSKDADISQSVKLKVHFDVNDASPTKGRQIAYSDEPATPHTPIKMSKNFVNENPVHMKTASTSESLKNEDSPESERRKSMVLTNEKQNFDSPKQNFAKRSSERKFVRFQSGKFRPMEKRNGRNIKEEIQQGLDRSHSRTPSQVSEISQSRDSFSLTSAEQDLKRKIILKAKLSQLSDKFRKQKVELDTLTSETTQFTYELNQLKLIYSKEIAEAVKEEGHTKVGGKRTFNSWQLLLVSVGFLIIGSLIFS